MACGSSEFLNFKKMLLHSQNVVRALQFTWYSVWRERPKIPTGHDLNLATLPFLSRDVILGGKKIRSKK